MKAIEAINALSALASDPRLTVYRLLVKRGPEGYTPSELIERLDVPAPTLSFRREGRNLHYSPNFERMSALVGFLTENCCSLAGEACDTNCQPRTGTAAQRKRA
jgi:ArsR family transcriptional regulator